MLEKILDSPLDYKEIKTVSCKGNQPWMFIGRTDADAEAPVVCPPNVKSWLIRKDPDARKDWRQEENGMTEDEMVAWHHWLTGHEFEQASGDGEGQESLMCCNPRGHKELDTIEWLNNSHSREHLNCISLWDCSALAMHWVQSAGEGRKQLVYVRPST